ncbi:MAG: TonB family protein [Prevotella sp.]|nr:TonB family protein [Prevotella sp.]
METKKSSKADLEGKRPQRFLLGLVVALSAFFVAMEFNISPDDPLDDPEFLELIDNGEELAPLFRPENELALAPKAEPEPTLKLKVVDDDEQPADQQLDQQLDALVEGDPQEDDLPEAEEEDEKEEDPVLSFRVVEDIPKFPGGPGEFMKWLTRNLKYPPVAQTARVQGQVLAEFIVNKDGSVTDVRIVRSLNSYCDAEALRVLRMMPRWTAGIDHGQPCRTKICIPIIFKL